MHVNENHKVKAERLNNTEAKRFNDMEEESESWKA